MHRMRESRYCHARTLCAVMLQEALTHTVSLLSIVPFPKRNRAFPLPCKIRALLHQKDMMLDDAP